MKSKHILPKYKETARAFCISFFYILTLCQCKSPAQKGSDGATETIPGVTAIKAPLPTAKIQDSISINANQATQAINWSTINTDFMTNCLNPFLASKRIKSDCTHCDKIMFSFSFVVDGKGKIQTILKEGENISCFRMSETDKKKLEKEILIYIKKLVLPASFYKTIYKGNLGFIRKC
ncbi:hypothetical protein [Pedobacter hiemivivus]|uniref:Uncharacterized protein n=1 Tax=Pedobacter hiemivivus TaxID=2530454 RepID=A0A4R0NJP8_9SPHI|nr:hypothetical protein [Pedobacter hiemivivus]TCC99662.1 hypothetical protein EZ444_03045 [Pedobacter hiemivivus]